MSPSSSSGVLTTPMTVEVSHGPKAGVVGSPIEHSLSPVLHRAAYRALGLSEWTYHRNEVPAGQLSAHLAGLDRSWAGLSVTMPGKEEALGVSVGASQRAMQTGAANTLVRRSGGWWADNTDIDGITRALAERGCEQPQSAWLIGSGATARSALMACAEMGVGQIVLQVRLRPRPETLELCRLLGLDVIVRAYAEGWPDLRAIDVAISTVPAGAQVPAAATAMPAASGVLALDVVYAPWPTDWATQMSTAGAEVIDGSAMLLHQAAEQVALMTGQEAPVEAMRTALGEALKAGE